MYLPFENNKLQINTEIEGRRMRSKTTSWNKLGSWNSLANMWSYYRKSQHVLQPCTNFKVNYQQTMVLRQKKRVSAWSKANNMNSGSFE